MYAVSIGCLVYTPVEVSHAGSLLQEPREEMEEDTSMRIDL